MSNKVVRVNTETVEKDISFLSDVDVAYISLVKYGANRVPFKIVKSENKGGVSMVVQSILVPKNKSFDSILSENGLEWLSDAKKEEVQEYTEYNKYIQFPIEKLDKESLTLAQLSNTGVWAIVGKADKDTDISNALVLGKNEVKKFMSVPQTVGDTVIAEVKTDPIPITFNQMFEKELSSCLDVIKGSLTQTNINSTQRRKMVMNALDAFKSFVGMSLDTLDVKKNTAQKNDNELYKLEEKIEQITNILKSLEKGGNIMLFKDKEDFEKQLSEYLDKRENEKKEAEKKAQKEAAKKTTAEQTTKTIENETTDKKTEADVDVLKEVSKQINEISEKVKAIAEKQDKYEEQLATTPAAGDTDNLKIVEKSTEKESVFKGILSKKVNNGGE